MDLVGRINAIREQRHKDELEHEKRARQDFAHLQRQQWDAVLALREIAAEAARWCRAEDIPGDRLSCREQIPAPKWYTFFQPDDRWWSRGINYGVGWVILSRTHEVDYGNSSYHRTHYLWGNVKGQLFSGHSPNWVTEHQAGEMGGWLGGDMHGQVAGFLANYYKTHL